MRESEQFGQQFREERFGHAVIKMLALQKSYADFEKHPVDENLTLLITDEFEEAARTLAFGIFSLYVDILDRGNTEEIERARVALGILQQPPITDLVVFEEV